MKIDWLIILCVPLPILGAALAGHAIRKDLPRATPVQIPITGQGLDASGNRITLSGSVTLTTDAPVPTPTPTPTPTPLTLAYLAAAPAVVAPGGSAVVTVVLSRAAGAPVVVAMQSADPLAQVAATMTISTGQSSGTVAVTTSSTITTERLLAIVATLNGQSRSANLTVRPGLTPVPTPAPFPTPTPEPTPVPLGPLTPQVESLSNPDGTPLTLPLVPGQAVRVFGERFGVEAGELFGNGYPLPVVSWGDTAAVGRLSWSCAAISVGVRTRAGGYYAGSTPDEPWKEAPGPEPPSSRRR